MKIENLVKAINERMGNSRNLNQDALKFCILRAANDIISEFKQNVNIVTYDISEDRQIKIKNIAYIFSARFDGVGIPLYRLSQIQNEGKNSALKLIVLDTQSVRVEPHSKGVLEILGSFFIDEEASEIPLSANFERVVLQGAICELYVLLDKPIDHIKSAKIILNEFKDELRSQINRAQEKSAIITRNIRI